VQRKHVVVAGNGMVGQRFVEALRERDVEGIWSVTVFGDEPVPAYDRVNLSSLFEGRTPDELDLVPAGCYDDRTRRLHLGEAITAVDTDGRTVTTSQGRTVGYDALVLATGSLPFVPPVPGRELPNCFVYRTQADVAAITAAATDASRHTCGRRSGVVVGGGLLGLEAARALRQLGLSPHVVELAPRLMPVQVDDGGGRTLRRLIEALPVSVFTGTSVERIDADTDRLTVRLADGDELDTDLVVFAAGIRPRDDLARSSGLTLAPRGGFAVDTACRASAPDVYAIGECASVEGTSYGLVAPGYAMAQTVADRLVGGEATFAGADTSTKLKLLDVDVASFGDAHARTPGALEVTVDNVAAGTYAKLVVDDAATRLLGGILVGDTTRYPALRPLVGRALPADPVAMVAAVTAASGELPDDAQVCSCHDLNKGAICAAIVEHELSSVAQVKACTKAGTGCGSCVPLLENLLVRTGVPAPSAMCEHIPMTRADLYSAITEAGLQTFTAVIERLGTGRGCHVCKPAVASILNGLVGGHVLDGDQAGLQDTNDHVLANMQRNGTYSVVPRIPGGEITPDGLIAIGHIARDFGLYTKITGGQRIDMFGARIEQLPAIWRRLVDAGFESGHAYGKALRTVKSCVGSTWCRFGVQDSVSLAIDLELRYRGLRAPHKLKSAVSGCARECAEARSKDFGVIATEHGWNLYVGGNGGFSPRHADLLLRDVDTATLVRTIDRFLIFYIRTAERLQRTAPWVAGLSAGGVDGLEYLRSVLVDDSLGICAELDTAMARHVDSYRDEWAGVLDDAERLRRFASFVNAPTTPDPDITFVLERDQPRPGPRLVADAELAPVPS
jgi:nitrite reductase (NADH) large subunit